MNQSELVRDLKSALTSDPYDLSWKVEKILELANNGYYHLEMSKKAEIK
jgi:hypothetical protein